MSSEGSNCSSSKDSGCGSSGACKIWYYVYGLCQLLVLTCIATSLWNIIWALEAVAEAIKG